MKAQTLSGRYAFDLFEMIERLLQAGTIDLNPTPTDQHQALRAAEELFHLGGAQRLAFQCHRDGKIEQRILANL